MNTKIRKIAVVLSVMLLSIPVFGQASGGGGGGGGGAATTATPVTPSPQVGGELPSTLPISSPELLIANAKRLVAKVAVNVWSRGFVHGAPGTVTYFEKEYIPSMPNQPDFGEFLAIVGLAHFSFETRNPLDPIEVRVEFRDKGGRSLFQGNQSFKLVKNSDGSYAPPSQEIKVRVWPSGDLPLEIAGADWVEIALLNEQGETTETRTLDRDQRTGNFMFPVHLAGQKNVLVMASDNREDGITIKALYSAQTGARNPTITRSVTASATLENVYLPDAGNAVTLNMVDEQAARIFRNGISPLVQVTFLKPQTLFFYAELPTEVAKGFWVRRGDQIEWVYFTITRGKPAEVGLGAGVWDIIIDWPTFGKRDQSFGGGKG